MAQGALEAMVTQGALEAMVVQGALEVQVDLIIDTKLRMCYCHLTLTKQHQYCSSATYGSKVISH